MFCLPLLAMTLISFIPGTKIMLHIFAGHTSANHASNDTITGRGESKVGASAVVLVVHQGQKMLRLAAASVNFY
jgi:hypothetical protein